jgi:hypothetical protein
MSLWWHKRDKSGKKLLWQIDFEPLSVMMLFALLFALIGPGIVGNPSRIILFPFALLLIGFTCLLISKISIYRKGIWLSFGSKHMSKGYATLYRTAYILIGLGVLLLVAVFNAIRSS